MSTCIWEKAWIGRCPAEAVENGRCKEHQKACVSCGDPATHECEETGQFVCGAPLCGNCEHTRTKSGTNGGIGFSTEPLPEGMGAHCRRSEQRYEPWFSQGDPEDEEPEPTCQVPVSLLENLLDNTYELRGERSWWKDEVRLQYQSRYQGYGENIKLAEEILEEAKKNKAEKE